MKNKVALVWDAERAGREIDAVWQKREAVERKRADYDDTLLKLLLEAKANYHMGFKHFVETYTHISLTTAKRTLRIADGRGEDVRQQERERQQKHRAGEGVTSHVTPSPVEAPALVPVTEPEVVTRTYTGQGGARFKKQVEAECKRVGGTDLEISGHFASSGRRGTMTYEATYRLPVTDAPSLQEFTQAEANRQGRSVDMLVDDGAVVRVEPEAPPVVPEQVPEPVETFPVLGKTTTADAVSLPDMTVKDIDRLFAGLDHNNDDTMRFDGDTIDLELSDLVERAAGKLRMIAQSLRNTKPIHDALTVRQKAAHEAWEAERKAKAEADEAARLARIKWEIDHGDEARKAYYAEALAKAKDDRDYETDEGDFDQAAFDAAYKPGENGRVDYGNPEHDFFERWRKEHHTIWPGHMEVEPDHPALHEDHKQRNRRIERAKAAVKLDHITDMKLAREHLDAADNFEGMCALADFMKVERPSSPIDRQVDPADVGSNDRWNASQIWKHTNEHYIAAKAALSDKVWRHEEPKEAAEHDREQSKKDAETKRRLIAEAKSPAKVKAKALKDAKRDAMDGDMESAKEDARESGDRWSDQKDEWIEQWEAENWGEDEAAAAEAEFFEDWQDEHGQPFPTSNYAGAK